MGVPYNTYVKHALQKIKNFNLMKKKRASSKQIKKYYQININLKVLIADSLSTIEEPYASQLRRTFKEILQREGLSQEKREALIKKGLLKTKEYLFRKSHRHQTLIVRLQELERADGKHQASLNTSLEDRATTVSLELTQLRSTFLGSDFYSCRKDFDEQIAIAPTATTSSSEREAPKSKILYKIKFA